MDHAGGSAPSDGAAGGSPLRGLDPSKAALLRALFAELSDAQVERLASVLKGGADMGGSQRHAHDLIVAEQADRQARDAVFAPLAPLVRRAAEAPSSALSPDALRRLWRVLRDQMGPRVDAIVRAVRDLDAPDDARRACDDLALDAAERLESGAAGWEALRDALDSARPNGAQALAQHLRLTPLVRAAAPRLRAWVRTASPQHASALKLAYRDAAGLGDDAPPRLLEMLSGGLQHDWAMLRLIEAVMDRPADSFLAASELGAFAEQVLDDVDGRLKILRGFDPTQGAAAAERAAQAVCAAVNALVEFDRCIDARPGGAWAKRIAVQRRMLARDVETRLKQADGALARALPVFSGPFAGVARGAPRLDEPLEPLIWDRANALIALLAGVRPAAEDGGFAVVRAKAAEALDLRLSLYADDLVQVVHDGAPEASHEALARLALIADALGQVRDAKAADVIRRRAAAAVATATAA